MLRRMICLLVMSIGLVQLAQAADPAANKSTGRWAGSVQLDVAAGGDDLYDDNIQLTTADMGTGVTLSAGLLYRPFESSVFELQGWLGYKFEWVQPILGNDIGFSRTVVQLLGNYRNDDKWYVGGGPVFHINPKFEDDWFGYEEFKFDDAVGLTIEGGWNWVGLQCTYIEYKASGFGKYDASNCGVRFTFRFPRWRPVD
jgi:hypothetical protein